MKGGRWTLAPMYLAVTSFERSRAKCSLAVGRRCRRSRRRRRRRLVWPFPETDLNMPSHAQQQSLGDCSFRRRPGVRKLKKKTTCASTFSTWLSATTKDNRESNSNSNYPTIFSKIFGFSPSFIDWLIGKNSLLYPNVFPFKWFLI